MRPAISLVPVLMPSALAWRRSGWAGRLIIAALLIALAALVLTPNSTSAHHTPNTSYANHCRGINDDRLNGVLGSLMDDLAANQEFVEDCIALLKASEDLTAGDGTRADWLTDEDAMLPILAQFSMSESSWDGIWIEEVGDAPNQVYRITQVDLSEEDLGGRLSADWANLTALTSLDLSGNKLEGTVPYDVWALLDGLETLNLDGNKDLRPSPPLNLGAWASKTADGETQVTLSFRAIWYTLEVPRHEYRYSADGGTNWGPNTAAGSEGWMSTATGCIDSGTPRLCSKDNGAIPPGRNRVAIESGPLPKSDTYIFQVRAVKDVVTITDDKGNNDPADDETETTTTRSRVSQIDVVGPQVLTAESDFLLELGASYRVAEPLPDASVLVVESADGGLQFRPKAATGEDGVIVNLTQSSASVTNSRGVDIGLAGGALSFPVESKPASTAPTKTDIPNRSILSAKDPTQLDLTSHFQGEDLTYTAGSSRPGIATVAIDEETGELVITAIRNGVTFITVTATNPDRGKTATTFRVTVSLPNDPPEAVGAVPDQTLYLDDAGAPLDLTGYFRDPDNDRLRLFPQSSNPMVVTATSNGNNVTFNVVGVGEASMTVIAEDPNGATAFITFTVTVLPPNEAPEAVDAIPAQTLRLGGPDLELDIAPYFTDANGDPLTFSVESADESIVIAVAAESVVTMTAITVGETTAIVTATDPRGESAAQEAAVTVLPANRPPQAVGSIDNQVLVVGGNLLTIDMGEYFSDPDGDALTFDVASSNPEAVQAIIIGGSGSLALTPLTPAEDVAITVIAMDPDGESAEQTFTATVVAEMAPATPTPTVAPAPVVTPTPTQTPEPTASPTPAPTATAEPTPTETPATEDAGGPPLGLILMLVLVVVAAVVLMVQRRRGSPTVEG